MPDNHALLRLLDRLAATEQKLLGTGFKEGEMEAIEQLAKMELEPSPDFAQWPLISFQIPPHMKRAFLHITREATEDRDRFELLLRLSGWDGS